MKNETGNEIFDVGIVGAGLSGLLIADELSQISTLKIKIFEPEVDSYPSRTWCFWAKSPPKNFPVFKTWSKISLQSHEKTLILDPSPYQYCMVRSRDWREQVLNRLSKNPSISWENDPVTGVEPLKKSALIHTPWKKVPAQTVFDSRFDLKSLGGARYQLYQQFVGYFVKSPPGTFDPEIAGFMNFAVPGRPDVVSFVYCLPTSDSQALIEYTVFTSHLLERSELESFLEIHLNERYQDQWEKVETEYGVIPMSDLRFPRATPAHIRIGTAAGNSKPSTGFTLRFVQRHNQRLTTWFRAGKRAEKLPQVSQGRFRFYDQVMLDIMSRHPEKVSGIMMQMFEKNPTDTVLAFLDEQSTFPQELKIFSTLPIGLFLRAALRQLAGSNPKGQ